MKKFACLFTAVLLIACLTASALASVSIEFGTGKITGSCNEEGNIEFWVNGRLAGGSSLNVTVPAGEYTVKVYKDGKEIMSKTGSVTEEGSSEPVVTEAPEEPEKPTVKPTKKPSSSSNDEENSNSYSDDVPKTGDSTVATSAVITIMVAAIVILALRKFVFSK